MNSNKKSTSTLQPLNDLITALSEGERSTYNHIIYSLKLKPNALDKYASWSSECYTRNCIVNTENFELILICWCASQRTSIHDHGGEECWVKIIKGDFKETTYKEDETGNLNIIKSAILKPNKISYMKYFMGFHRLENISKKRSMSLHLYAKPIRSCRMFDEKSKKIISKYLSYNTIA